MVAVAACQSVPRQQRDGADHQLPACPSAQQSAGRHPAIFIVRHRHLRSSGRLPFRSTTSVCTPFPRIAAADRDRHRHLCEIVTALQAGNGVYAAAAVTQLYAIAVRRGGPAPRVVHPLRAVFRSPSHATPRSLWGRASLPTVTAAGGVPPHTHGTPPDFPQESP